MMKLKHLIENFPLAREALQIYPHDADSLEGALSRFRISSNAVYPFFQQGRLCFLRLAPASEKQLPDVQAEIAFIRSLRRCGFPAMEPFPTLQGEYAFTLDTAYGPYCVSAFKGVSGKPLEDTPITADVLRAYGQALGRLHALSSGMTEKLSRPRWDEALSPALLQQLSCPPAASDACRRLFDALRKLPCDRDGFGLIHYDFEPDNVFIDDAGQISVIDFDDCLYGWFAMDVEQALDCLGELTDTDAAPLFLEGYRSAFPFSAEQEAQRPLMRRYIDLRAYARLKWCLSEPVADPPAWMPPLRRRLEARLKQLENTITA